MIGQPHWFGPAKSTFAIVHWPDAEVRAGVVICPPVGYEAISIYTTLRVMAESLATKGFAVMRVAFPTTGNSLRTGAGDDVAEWEHAIVTAVEEIRSFGVSRVAIVGVRLSATLVANLASRLSPEALVLWDPVASGRRYTRGLRLLATEADNGVVSAGIVFDSDTLSSMTRVSLDIDELRAPTLVIQRTEPTSEAALVASTDLPVTVERLEGTTNLLDTDAELAVVPTKIIKRVCAWLDSMFDRSAARVVASPTFCCSTNERVGSTELVHEAVRFGPNDLFAVVTTCPPSQPTRAMIFLNNGASPAVGPGSAWIDWAAEVAGAGLVAVRLDLNGLGDSPSRSGSVENDSYPIGAGEDVSDAIDMLGTRGVSLVSIVGLCSGSVLAFDAALRRDEVEHIMAINPRIDKPFHDRSQRSVRAGGQTNRLFAIPLRKKPLFPTLNRIPAPIWRALSLLHLVPRPTLAVERAVARGTAVSFIFGPNEWGLMAMRRRAPRHWAQLEASPKVAVTLVDALDHSMFAPEGRREVERVLRKLLATDDFASPASIPPNSEVTSR
jgi:pimeloyl-ACP methyl ester carboxylesterase